MGQKIEVTDELRERVKTELISLIENDRADTFLLGDRSVFNDLCREVLTELKEKYPHIKRIYVRAEYEDKNDDCTAYLLERCDETIYPSELSKWGKFANDRRDQITVEKCKVLVVYYDENDVSETQVRSKTNAAVYYAGKRHKRVINVFRPKEE